MLDTAAKARALTTQAEKPKEFQDTDQDKIKTILNAIESGWEQADSTPFSKHFLDYEGARYVESGGQNIGLTDLIEHHVEPEGKSLKLDLNFNNPVITIKGHIAWVIVDAEVHATVYKTSCNWPNYTSRSLLQDCH